MPTDHIDIVFDGTPDRFGGRFIEVEDAQRRGVKGFGEWVQRDDGFWVYRITRETAGRYLAAPDGGDGSGKALGE